MISTICNEVIYPFTNFRAANLGKDIFCIELPMYISKTITKTTSIYQLSRVAKLFFDDVAKDCESNFAVAINRSLGELCSNHRLLIDSKNSEILEYLKSNNPHAVVYDRLICCYQNSSNDPEFMTKLAIDLVLNTNSFVLLMNPNRIICHRKTLHSLNHFCHLSPFNSIPEEIVADQVFAKMYVRKNTNAMIFDYSDVYVSIKKAIHYRKRSITFINEFDKDVTWEYGSSLITNSKMIIFKIIVEKQAVYIHFNTHTMKAICLGMSCNFQVKELFREYRDYVRYNKTFFDIFI